MLAELRAFFAARDVLEVQTPVLGRHTVTDPAIESMRLADPERYLQTSPEYHMKRLLAAGAPSIYQVGPVFRAGEAGRWHNPEFTMVEWYRLDYDAARLMAEVAGLVDALIGPGTYEYRTYAEVMGRRFGIEIASACDDEVLEHARALGLGKEAGVEEALDLLFAEAVDSLDAARVFITGFPKALAALAEVDASGLAERFELVVDGVEIANGYNELRDAGELARRMERDADRRRDGGQPEVGADGRLLAAQRHGLPRCAGVAVGFDRLVALRLGAAGLAEVLAFDWSRA